MFAGLDLGASHTKCVLIDTTGRMLGKAACRTGADFAAAAEKAFAEAHSTLPGGPKAEAVCATGYGRTSTPLATMTRTEISCQALGCVSHFPGQALTIVDIGGQDTKTIKVEPSGKRTDFKMNRKCAAGTGAFLEEMAHRLEIPLGDFDALARAAKTPAAIGSFCTVFAATEMIARIRSGESRESIVRGIFVSLVKRVRELDLNVSAIGELERVYQRGVKDGIFRKGLNAIDLH
jgi:predicted CoA-substrate-specific enzyme activase